ncbi:uncharacterized protein SPAPADRAFT_133563 [Spathaspora passalidarum NRRL Y-27907]|uniref:Chloride channel protein n=1 Tax=Spathaspora passalidarum (strain NRRL Y-27907 / 11-Y1) TaxID=619300 RepID=G3AID9_SPAPN|nr:uncharacterized protein SPAPADRAFT_133563 [Spathaspora passalidarum NRRL Y-27907]EGW34409.1 hypothetical protein SPAPADRAFT_133563 [Spathaspora passalidarum NRRL Y-27907]
MSPLLKIKSLNKIDIRSPIDPDFSVLLTPGVNTIANTINNELGDSTPDLLSLRTIKTNASRIFSIVPNTFYSIQNFYNDFTTIDWGDAYILANKFNYELETNRWIGEDGSSLSSQSSDFVQDQRIPFYKKAYFILGKWILIVAIGFIFSLIAFSIDKFEILLVGFKRGYCKTNWFASQVACCSDSVGPNKIAFNVFKSGVVPRGESQCSDWISWSNLIDEPWFSHVRLDFTIYVVLSVILAVAACIITLTTKISGGTIPRQAIESDTTQKENTNDQHDDENHASVTKQRIMYTAHGSGVPEVKTILSGFVIRRFLGTYTLIAKTSALIFAIASGMALGKEGPYVHLATCVGNIMSRYFPFIYDNELLKKQILSASASAGVALAFGSPLGGVLFILEEINNYLPSHTLFQIFFCAIISTLFLKFLNPYGTGNTVLFELRYFSDWKPVELILFIIVGIAGGLFGAGFVKFVRWWPKKFRTLKPIQNHPVFEVFCISLVTGLVTFWNPYTKQASTELVLDLATPCSAHELDRSLCPTTEDQYVREMGSLLFAFIVKVILTFITFGLRVPCGIYVPSMVAGALYGRLFSMSIQWASLVFNRNEGEQNALGSTFKAMGLICSPNSPECVDMGIYAMISAGAFMAGVTRMNITIVTILFELTSSYTYVLPISIAIAVANWSGGLFEKNSLYEAMLISNDYPFMSPETEAIDPFVTAGEIIEKNIEPKREVDVRGNIVSEHVQEDKKLYLDVSKSCYVSVNELQSKLILLADQCLNDGCLPLLKKDVCVGMLYFPELEARLDKIKEFCVRYEIKDEIYCKVMNDDDYDDGDDDDEYNTSRPNHHICHNDNVIRNVFQYQDDYFNYGSIMVDEYMDAMLTLEELTNLTRYVDWHPLFIDYDCELSFAHLIFDRIGIRVIVLLKEGKYYGILHKKVLVDYLRR